MISKSKNMFWIYYVIFIRNLIKGMEFDKPWERRGKCVWYDGFLFVFCKLVSVNWKVTGFYEYKNTEFYKFKK